CSRRAPPAASRSMFGVLMSEPWYPTSFHPRSSATMTTMFGRCPGEDRDGNLGACDCAEAPAGQIPDTRSAPTIAHRPRPTATPFDLFFILRPYSKIQVPAEAAAIPLPSAAVLGRLRLRVRSELLAEVQAESVALEPILRQVFVETMEVQRHEPRGIRHAQLT